MNTTLIGKQLYKSKPPAKPVVCTMPSIIPAAPKGALNSPATAVLSRAAAKAAFSYALGFLLPVNGSMYSLNDSWSAMISSSS